MKVEFKIVDGHQAYVVRTPGGDLPFETLAEAEEFVEWMVWLRRRSRARAEEAQAWSGREARSNSPLIHDLATALAYVSFALTAANAVEQVHLAMARQILSALEHAAEVNRQSSQSFAEKMSRMRAAEAQPQKKKTSDGPKM